MNLRTTCLIATTCFACQGNGDPRKGTGSTGQGGPGATSSSLAVEDSPRVLEAAPFQQSVFTLVGHGTRFTASTFERLQASLSVQGDRPRKLELKVDLASVVGSDKDALSQLRARTGIDPGGGPFASFRSTEIRPGSRPGSFVISGDLDLLGQTHELVLPAQLRTSAESLDLEVRAEVSPATWETAMGARAFKLFTERLEVIVRLVFPRAAAAAAPWRSSETRTAAW